MDKISKDAYGRLEQEHKELVEKYEKLQNFLRTDKFDALSPLQQDLLVQQYYAMRQYAATLQQRLDSLSVEED